MVEQVERQAKVPQQRVQIPYRLLTIGVILVIIALILAPMVAGMSDKDKTNNVLMTGVPFILILVAIVIGFASLNVVAARGMNNCIPQRLHQIVEWLIIGGIVVGVVGMFQPLGAFGLPGRFLALDCVLFTIKRLEPYYAPAQREN